LGKRGPSTETGKAVISLNAVRHGMLATSPVVPAFERQEDWRDHLEGIETSLAPADHFESCLVERIALLLWRLRRVTAFETETMVSAVGDSEADWERAEGTRKELAAIPFYGKDAREHPPAKEEWVKRRQADRMIPSGTTLERVMRYEAHLHRQLLQTMHELEALQARRKGEATPLARLDAST
jgi:hypothetical protein